MSATAFKVLAMYLIPLGILAWLYKKNPAYAFIGVVVIAVLFGATTELP